MECEQPWETGVSLIYLEIVVFIADCWKLSSRLKDTRYGKTRPALERAMLE